MTLVIGGSAETNNNPSILWNNILEYGTVTTDSETDDGYVTNCLGDETYDFWTLDTDGYLFLDYGEDVSADCIGIASHTLGSNGAEFYVEYSDDNTLWNTAISGVDPVNDETTIAIFQEATARYWRIYVDTGGVSIGVIKLGKRDIIDGGVISGHLSLHHAKEYDLVQNRSVRGQFLGTRVLFVGGETDINFGLLPTDDVEALAGFEDHFNSGRAFFLANRPVSEAKDIGYCRRSESASEIKPTNEESGALMGMSMGVEVFYG